MNLSIFLNILYAFCGNGKNIEDFVIETFDIIIGDYENPFLDYCNIRRVFAGARPLSKKIASIILVTFNKQNFINYLSSQNNKILVGLSIELEKYNIVTTLTNIPKKCAEILFDIICESSKKTANTCKKVKPKKLPIKKLPTYQSHEYILLNEAQCKCPCCHKSFQKKKHTSPQLMYKITTIYPLEKSQLALLKEIAPPTELNNYDNKIALCLDCNFDYSSNVTKEKYLDLKRTKAKLVNLNKAKLETENVALENNLQFIISALNKNPIHEKSALPAGILNIRHKISNSLLQAKIEYYVINYYKLIEKLFNEAEKAGLLNFNIVSQEVQLCFEKLQKSNLTQEELFNLLSEWVKDATSTTSDTACQIIIAFFIQNTNIFNRA